MHLLDQVLCLFHVFFFHPLFTPPGPCSMGDQDLVNTLVQHHSNSASVISVSGRKYIIPSCSTFLLSDISNAHLLTSGKKMSLSWNSIFGDSHFGGSKASNIPFNK